MIKIAKLKEQIIQTQTQYLPNHPFNPIFGGGKEMQPKFMFIFINPTVRNISSDKTWKGPIFPFIGTKHIWRIFHKANMFDDNLLFEINNNNHWSYKLSQYVLDYLKKKSYYFTNLVKLVGYDATLPTVKLSRIYLPLLEKEIAIINPRYIVTFGLIPFKMLISEKLKLSDYFIKSTSDNNLKLYHKQIGTNTYPVVPNYFPIGRGNPQRAVEILRLINKSL